MVIGETRYFDLAPVSGVPLNGYTATWQLVFMGNIMYTGAVGISGDNLRFEVRIDTETMQPNTYDLRIYSTYAPSGLTSIIYREKLALTR